MSGPIDKDYILWILGTGTTVLLAVSVGMVKAMKDMSDRLKAVETKIEPFWNLIGDKMSKILHSPHTPVLDRLLEKYDARTITVDETRRLAEMLIDIEQDRDESKADRLAACLFLMSMEIRHGRLRGHVHASQLSA